MNKLSHTLKNGVKCDTAMFNSLSQLADYVEKSKFETRGDNSWAGGSKAQCVQNIRQGDMSLVAKSDTLLTKFENMALDTDKRVWIDAMAGALPNVQAHLAGHPMAMRARSRVASPAAPITVFVDVFASAKFKHDAIETRGAAVLALVRVLSTVRPVTLYAGLTSNDGNGSNAARQGFAVRIDTQPLDLARAAFVLSSPLFLRRASFCPVEELGAESGIPFPQGGAKAAIELMSPILAPESPLIVSPAMSSNDDLAVSNPEKWIADTLRSIAPETFLDAA